LLYKLATHANIFIGINQSRTSIRAFCPAQKYLLNIIEYIKKGQRPKAPPPAFPPTHWPRWKIPHHDWLTNPTRFGLTDDAALPLLSKPMTPPISKLPSKCEKATGEENKKPGQKTAAKLPKSAAVMQS